MVDTIFSSMKRGLIRQQKREIASLGKDTRGVEQRIKKMPSQLDKDTKKQYRKELSEEKSFYSRMKKQVKEEKSETTKKAKAIEKRRKEIIKKLGRLARKKVVSKKTFKKSKTTLHLKQREVPSILGDPNRFFKDEMEETKRSLFFT